MIHLDPSSARDLIERDHLDVVDVREPHEWLNGHLPNARLVPLSQLKANPRAALPRDGVVLVCAAGIRSQTAARIAESIGLSRVYNLSGGISAWAKAGFSIVRDQLSAVS